MADINARIRLRRGTAAEWASANPTLVDGEPGWETDTGLFKIGDGVTAWDSLPSYALDALENVTATPAELNVLDGITATTAELNHVSGVTSPVQTQINAKAPLASPVLTGTPQAPTAAAATDTTQLATTAFVQRERVVHLIETQVADDSGTLEFIDIPSDDYSDFFFKMRGLVPSVDNAILMMRVSTDGGVTFDTGLGPNDYSWQNVRITTGGVIAVQYDDRDTKFVLSDESTGPANDLGEAGYQGEIKFQSPAYGDRLALFLSANYNTSAISTLIRRIDGTMVYDSTSEIDSFRFYFNGALITVGNVSLYGVK